MVMMPMPTPGGLPLSYGGHIPTLIPTQPGIVEDEDDREKKKNEIPLHGNLNNFNMNKLLVDRIMENDYFKALYEIKTYHEVIDEIYNRVTHVEPWSAGTGRLPSTAWCLLTKFFTMRLTTKQMSGLLRHKDSPQIRAVGFLYLRVATEPKNLWRWFEEFIDDAEEFTPSADPTLKMTMGKFCIKILTDMNYYNTMLPRIPVPIERQIKAHLILFEEEQRRADANLRSVRQLKPGMEVRAIYSDEDNDPAWYNAVVNEVMEPEEDGQKPMVVVTFPEYGNQECLSLGKLDLSALAEAENDQPREKRTRDRSRSREHKKSHKKSHRRSRSRSRERKHDKKSRKKDDRDRDRDRDRDSDRRRSREKDPPASQSGGSLLGGVMAEVTKRDRERSAAHGKDYAQRPASYKGSLSLKLDRFTHRKKSRSRSPDRSVYRRRSPPRDKAPDSVTKSSAYRTGGHENSAGTSKYLKERYGDASRK